MNHTHVDAIGQVISVGDTLFYGQTGRYAGFMTCRVVRSTPHRIVVDVLKCDRDGVVGTTLQIANTSHCIVITKLVDIPIE